MAQAKDLSTTHSLGRSAKSRFGFGPFDDFELDPFDRGGLRRGRAGAALIDIGERHRVIGSVLDICSEARASFTIADISGGHMSSK
jgi:hypothetical protein